LNPHNDLTFEQLANAMDISKAALRISCQKQGNPGQRIIPKLAEILDCTEGEIRRMIRENQLEQMHEHN
jgi:transcriptional regulator with XRE-family HTH domain